MGVGWTGVCFTLFVAFAVFFFTSGWFRVKAGSVLGMGWMVEMVYYTCGGWGWLCGI